jgi:hypothetical protein
MTPRGSRRLVHNNKTVVKAVLLAWMPGAIWSFIFILDALVVVAIIKDKEE